MNDDYRPVNTTLEAWLGAAMLLIVATVGSVIGIAIYVAWLALRGPA